MPSASAVASNRRQRWYSSSTTALPISSPRRAAPISTSARAPTSRRPRFSPCPAIGCTPCAASPTSATAGAHEAFGQRQRQGIGEPRARQRDLAQKIAKPRPQRRQIAVVIQRLNGRGRGVRLAPDDRGMMPARQRQDRQRAGGHEELMRGAFVVLLMANGRDQRGLAIAPALPRDPRARRHARAAPVAADQQPPASVRRPEASVTATPCGATSCATHGFTGQQGDARLGLHRLPGRPRKGNGLPA